MIDRNIYNRIIYNGKEIALCAVVSKKEVRLAGIQSFPFADMIFYPVYSARAISFNDPQYSTGALYMLRLILKAHIGNNKLVKTAVGLRMGSYLFHQQINPDVAINIPHRWPCKLKNLTRRHFISAICYLFAAAIQLLIAKTKEVFAYLLLQRIRKSQFDKTEPFYKIIRDRILSRTGFSHNADNKFICHIFSLLDCFKFIISTSF
ncbi:MAG: hypothetical protein HZB80_01785 [Deltaproteobacteria bacterium]|nr:hypothetical protein [Deltaproteobacteria bacterium]